MTEKDAEDLRKAMKGFGTDESTLIKIIANRTNKQRQQLKLIYKSKFGRDLVEDIKSECSGKFEDVLVALFKDPIDYDCECIRAATKGLGTDEDTLIEIIVSRPPNVLALIKQRYKEKYKEDLENVVKKETSGTLQKIFVSLLTCMKGWNLYPNQQECMQKANMIYNAGEKKLGTDESVFISILCNSSPAEMNCIANAYFGITGHSLLDAIDKEFSGDAKKSFKSLVYATISPSEYFADRVREAVKGAGTNDKLLMRVLITRDEIDMPQIKEIYKKKYGKDMVKAVKEDTSGDYKKLLVELCDH